MNIKNILKSCYILIIYVIIIFLFYLINFNIKIRKEKFIIRNNFPIDIVYTWKGEDFSNNIRNSYNYELKYSLRSIDEHAPWVNKIYILTDYPKKFPSWIKEDNDKIIIVDIKETFGNDDFLPNTNSNAIETTIINIKGLSEHYIYFCDDIFLGRKTSRNDFFTNDGKALVDKNTEIDNFILINQDDNRLNIDFPLTVNNMYPHIPIPQIKSLVIEFYNLYPDFIDWIRKTKKRRSIGCNICRKYNLHCPCQQIHYPICKYMYHRDKAVLTNNTDIKKAMFFMNNKLYLSNGKCILDNIILIRPLFFCINDDERNSKKRIRVRKDMLDFFNKYYPKKPLFEK